MFISVGLLLLTALYLGMVGVLEYYFHSQCSNGVECFSEAVDNTILNWSSDFFIAACIFCFSLHLSFYASKKRDVRKSGILTQIFMGGAFVASGVGNVLYPNSGTDDNHGMVGYWFVRMLYVVFFTVSGLTMASFAVSAAEKKFNMLLVFGGFLFISMCTFLAGGIWCSLNPDIQVLEIVDEFEPVDTVHACFRFMIVSECLLDFSYALLWLPVGLLLKVAARRQPISVLGLPSPAAAIIAVVLQWTVGSMLVGILFLVSLAPTVDFFDAWMKIYGTVLYHWAMLLTLYCLHNLAYGLPWDYYESDDDEDDDTYRERKHAATYRERNYQSERKFQEKREREADRRAEQSGKKRKKVRSAEEPSPMSWEWWVSGVASLFPEPKKKKSSDPYAFDENTIVTKSNFKHPTDQDGKKQVTFVDVAHV